MKPSAAPPFFEVYAEAGRQCLKVWPLLLVKFFFLLLQYAAFFLCLAILFGPFLARNLDGFLEGVKDPKGHDWSGVIGDWLAMTSDISWWVILAVVVVLYLTWWSLLAAFEDGGVYGAFWDLVEEGRPFSLGRFLERGIQLMMPMVWLQFQLGFWALLVLACWVVLGLVVVGSLAMLDFPLGLSITLGLLLGIPCVLFWILFGLGFGAFAYLCKAYLARGFSAGESVRTAFERFKADSWRVGLGMILALVLYIALTTAVRGVFMVLGMIPLLGILFQVLDLFLSMVMAIAVMIFLSGLSVTYLHDERAV